MNIIQYFENKNGIPIICVGSEMSYCEVDLVIKVHRVGMTVKKCNKFYRLQMILHDEDSDDVRYFYRSIKRPSSLGNKIE